MQHIEQFLEAQRDALNAVAEIGGHIAQRQEQHIGGSEHAFGAVLTRLSAIETTLIAMHAAVAQLAGALAGNNDRFDKIDAACGEAYRRLQGEVKARAIGAR